MNNKYLKLILLCLSLIMCLGVTTGCDAFNNPKKEVYKAGINYVRENLKSPSTAEFPKYKEEYVEDIGNGRFTVTAYYDAENSFGAKVREKFSCIVEKQYDGNYLFSNLVTTH